MNQIVLSNTVLPVVSSCDYLAAQEPFLHADRIADFHVMIYVTDGCIPVTEGNIDYEICPGELFFLKSGIRHFGKKEVSRGTRWHYVHFYLDNCTNCEKQDCPNSLQITLPKILRNLSGTSLENQVFEFTKSYHSEDSLDIWNRNQRFFQLLTVMAHYAKKEQVPVNLSDRIAQYLIRQYNQPFSAKDLEQQFFLSYKRMAAVFKKEKGMTMQQFHTNIRMEAACKLLRSTLLPVGEISREVGYADMLYFSRCFHAVMGISPTQYRRLPREY